MKDVPTPGLLKFAHLVFCPQAVLIPSCSLLFPMLSMRYVAYPQLINRAPRLLGPSALLACLAGVCVLTPLAVATVPAHVPLDPTTLEPEFRDRTDAEGRPINRLYSTRVLY